MEQSSDIRLHKAENAIEKAEIQRGEQKIALELIAFDKIFEQGGMKSQGVGDNAVTQD